MAGVCDGSTECGLITSRVIALSVEARKSMRMGGTMLDTVPMPFYNDLRVLENLEFKFVPIQLEGLSRLGCLIDPDAENLGCPVAYYIVHLNKA